MVSPQTHRYETTTTKQRLGINARFAVQNRGIFQTIFGNRLCNQWQTPLSLLRGNNLDDGYLAFFFFLFALFAAY